jgi:hypothetical protein
MAVVATTTTQTRAAELKVGNPFCKHEKIPHCFFGKENKGRLEMMFFCVFIKIVIFPSLMLAITYCG